MKLNLLVLKTHRLEPLRVFYSALGLSFVEEKHGSGPPHIAARVGDVVLELYPLPPDAGPADQTTRLGFTVPDLEAALQSLASAGATVASSPGNTPWGRRVVVRDPDGRAVELAAG
jgi:predicted enzyme related to lactoylglutathione lyase